MARISSFRAWRYNPQQVNLQQVVTQPYDKITPAMQRQYYDASPYNLVRIILGERLAEDGQAENVYSRAGAHFEKWRRAGILRQDAEPSIYRYAQKFRIPGTEITVERPGFIGLGRLESYSAGIVFRHEQTLAKPKADRLELLRATRAHFGQLFMLYSGAGKVDSLLSSSAGSEKIPDIEVTDEYDVQHRVWRIFDAGIIASVREQMREKKLIIADGHHRYETALTYRNERQAEAETGSGLPSPYDWVMMTFVDMDQPEVKQREFGGSGDERAASASSIRQSGKDRTGLVILPTHRLVFGLPSFSIAQFQNEAKKYFNVEEVDAGVDAARATTILRLAGHSGTALLAVAPDRVLLLHSPKMIGATLFGKLSLRHQELDVVQLHKCLLEGVLKISEEAVRNQENVTYCREAEEALAQVRNGKVQLALLMNPVSIGQLRDIALAGDVMPQKSTDFYPKLLSGLTIYALD